MGRVRALWRGEVKLWKAFWIFGIAAQLVFSFVFFKLNLLSVFNKPRVFLPINLMLLALFNGYGIFIFISIWKNGKKYEGARAWRYLSRLAAILVVIWFGANMGMYVYTKGSALFLNSKPDLTRMYMDQINRIPGKMTLNATSVQGETLNFGDFKLNFPNEDNIKYCWPDFTGHSMQAIFIKMKKPISLITIYDDLPSSYTHTMYSFLLSEYPAKKILSWLLIKTHFGQPYGFKTMHEIYYSRFEDYSWWDLRKNVRLAANLIIKGILPPWSSLSEIKTEYLKGFLTKMSSSRGYALVFQFYQGKNSCGATVISADKETGADFMNMLASFRSITDKNKAIDETEAMLAHKDKSPYPEDLLLCSLMSLKGPDVKSLEELKRLAEERHDTFDANSIDEEIKYLSGKAGK